MPWLLSLCESLEMTPLSISIRESFWTYPMLHFAHILSNSLMFGTIAFVDLRMLGVGLTRRRASEVARQLLPWTWIGWACMFISGSLIFTSDPVRYYDSTLYWIKMGLMVLAAVNALVFHFTTYRDVANWDLARPPARARLAGAFSLTTWIAVVFIGRAVGYFS
jgi:hypothetical protein